MKQFLIILTFSLFHLPTNNEIDKKLLPGTWKVVEFNANMPMLSPSLLKGGKDIALSSIYKLSSDGAYSLEFEVFSKPEKNSGMWTFKENSNLITLKETSEQTATAETFEIKSLTSKTMTWYRDMEEMGSISMTLEKIKD